MRIERPLHRRFRPASLFGCLLLGLASAASAVHDPVCPGGGSGTGTAVTNDNGFRAPFSATPCAQMPIVHAYACDGGWLAPADMWLGPWRCICQSIAENGSCPFDCGLELHTRRPHRASNDSPGGLTIPWCGVSTGSCQAEDGVVASYESSMTGQRQVRFDLRYHVAAAAQLPTILLRLAQPATLIPDIVIPVAPGDGQVLKKVVLTDGEWDVQVTLYDQGTCMPESVNELYAGGETENYVLCVSDSCISAPLQPLRSNH